MAIPGVANVAIWGQRDRQLQVLVDPERLRAHGVTLDEVVQGRRATACRCRPAASSTRRTSGSPSPTPPPSPRPRTSKASWWRLATAEPLRIGDVATVVEGFPPPIGDAVINDGPGLMLIVEKQPAPTR